MRAMYCRFMRKIFKITFAHITVLGLIFSLFISAPAQSAGLQRLHAVYDVNFGGFDLGKFQLWSEMSSKRYSILGKGKLSVFNGFFFEWEATTKSSGQLTPIGPLPNRYMFDYASSQKKEKLSLEFKNNAVSSIIVQPSQTLGNDQVPISRGDLTSVFDPLSAMIQLISLTGKKITSQMSSGQIACATNLPVFDGRERYDLVFSHKKTVQLQKTKKKGYSGPAYICQVKYIPISGHKPGNRGTKFMSESNEIEVWMIPMKKVDLYVPYHIVVPTPVGYATATSQIFQIEKAGDMIAFIN